MIDWSQFHFLRPAWLLLLAPLALAAWHVTRRRAGSRGWEAVCDAALLPHVLVGTAGVTAHRAAWPAALAGIVAIIALAGPAWTRLPQPVFSSTKALVIALDLSRSMNATDIAPSRVERARFKIADLLAMRRDGQTALLVYAGDAFTVAPLTDDAGTLLSQLPALTPGIMPVPGNDAAKALALARDLLKQAGLARGDVLLITDEVDGDDAAANAAALRGDGYRVSVLGVGTVEGAPVPQPDGSFLEDDSGQIVIAALPEPPLRQLARAGGGLYRRLALDDGDLQALAALLDQRPTEEETRATELQADVWRDEGIWLVLLLLPLAALGFRRGLVLAVLLLVAPLPRPAEAMEWQDLWLRSDQQGVRALEDGDAARAATLLEDPRWQGAARYRADDYEAAAGVLDALPEADSQYNRGNALARLGRYEEAIAAYDDALQRQPDHADAKFNRELVQQELERQQQQQQQQQSQEGQQGSDAPEGEPEQQADDQSSPSEGSAQGTPRGEPAPGSGEPQESEGAGAAQERGDDEDVPARAGADPDQAAPPGPGEEATARPEGAEPVPDGSDGAPEADVATGDAPVSEDQQALEQWLRRIPDDPGGLLRRKFQYQYQMRRAESGARAAGGKTW